MPLIQIIGLVFVLVGLGGLGYCIWAAMQMRKTTMTDDEARTKITRLTAINMGSLAVSTIGLGILLVSYLLG